MLQQLFPESRVNWKLVGAAVLSLTLLVLAFAWWLWGSPPAPAKPETYKPAAKQVDGSVVLERKPDPQATAKQQLPLGAKLKRLVSVTVQPRATVPAAQQTVAFAAPHPVFGSFSAVVVRPIPNAGQSPVVAPIEPAKCPPVTVDLSLAELPAPGGWRVVASSPDGAVVGGVDIPVEPPTDPPKQRLWAAGLVADPFRRTVGAFVDRDVGFLRLGLQVNQRNEGELPTQGWIKAGIRW